MGVSPAWLTLALFALAAAYPLEAEARDSWSFSKVSRAEPQPTTPGPASEQGYGLFGKKETYEYPPTTTNPTKSHGGREKQGMSDTRFLENGRYFYDLENENEEARIKESNDGHDTYYASDSGKQYKADAYGEKQGNTYVSLTGEKQGMSDTRFLENGRYFYDISADDDKNNKYGGDQEEEDELYGSRDTQGMSDARFADNGRYYHQLKGEESGQYNNNEYFQKESYVPGKLGHRGQTYADNNSVKFGKGYDFKTTPNKFPNYEFDSIEEYEKYEQGRSHQKEYAP